MAREYLVHWYPPSYIVMTTYSPYEYAIAELSMNTSVNKRRSVVFFQEGGIS